MGYYTPPSSGGGGGGISDITSTGGSIIVTSPAGPTTNIEGLLRSATVVFSAADLLANAVTPGIIVPAPGAGNVAFPVAGRFKLTFGTRVYDATFTAGPYLWWENNVNAVGPVRYPEHSSDGFTLSAFIVSNVTVAEYLAGFLAGNGGVGFDPAAYTNQPIVLQVGPNETLNAGHISAIAVTAPGSGYHVGDYLSTDAPAFGFAVNNSLLQVATVSGTGLATLTVVNPAANHSGVANVSANYGNLTASTLNAGGAGYAPGDTGTVSGGDNSATYVVNTVSGGGAVLTYTIDPTSGQGYTPAVNVATVDGGSQPGIGTGFTIDILSGGGSGGVLALTVLAGDGTLTVTIWYTVAPA